MCNTDGEYLICSTDRSVDAGADCLAVPGDVAGKTNIQRYQSRHRTIFAIIGPQGLRCAQRRLEREMAFDFSGCIVTD